MTERTISINRAPVLTLWAAVVAEAQGYDRATSLTPAARAGGLAASWTWACCARCRRDRVDERLGRLRWADSPRRPAVAMARAEAD